MTDAGAFEADAGAQWHPVPQVGPSPRERPGLAFDSDRGRLVLVGGYQADGTELDDTWEWDGAVWTSFGNAFQQLPATGDSMSMNIVFDSWRHTTLLFWPDVYGWDLMEWDGTRWANSSIPSGNYRTSEEAAMAFDDSRGQVVIVGSGNTLVFDGTSLLQASVAGPSALNYTALAYDSSRDRMVLFGGDDGAQMYGDTWEWDGAAWALVARAASNTPPARSGHAIAYDSARKRTVLFGGELSGGGYAGDTWEWDGNAWTKAASGPFPRDLPSITFDSRANQTLMFGGVTATGTPPTYADQADLWTYW